MCSWWTCCLFWEEQSRSSSQGDLGARISPTPDHECFTPEKNLDLAEAEPHRIGRANLENRIQSHHAVRAGVTGHPVHDGRPRNRIPSASQSSFPPSTWVAVREGMLAVPACDVAAGPPSRKMYRAAEIIAMPTSAPTNGKRYRVAREGDGRCSGTRNCQSGEGEGHDGSGVQSAGGPLGGEAARRQSRPPPGPYVIGGNAYDMTGITPPRVSPDRTGHTRMDTRDRFIQNRANPARLRHR